MYYHVAAAHKLERLYYRINGRFYYPQKPGMSRRLDNVANNPRNQFSDKHTNYIASFRF